MRILQKINETESPQRFEGHYGKTQVRNVNTWDFLLCNSDVLCVLSFQLLVFWSVWTYLHRLPQKLIKKVSQILLCFIDLTRASACYNSISHTVAVNILIKVSQKW